MPLEYTGVSANGNKESAYTRSSAVFNIDPDGKGSGTGYPFRGDIVMSYTDKESGQLSIAVGTSKYTAYIDKATGLIVMNASTTNTTFAKVWVLTPFETSNSVAAPSSYWNNGETRVIEYAVKDTVYRIFIHNGKVYFGTSFKDAAVNGNTIAAENCYNAKSLYVFGADGSEIARFAYNGTTMVKSDGTEGTYTNGDMKLVLNGAGFIDIYGLDGELSGTGTYTASEDTSYQYDVVLSDVSYKLSIDKDTYTVTKFESNCVTITYKMVTTLSKPMTLYTDSSNATCGLDTRLKDLFSVVGTWTVMRLKLSSLNILLPVTRHLLQNLILL